MFPQYGQIFSKYSAGANTPDKVVSATTSALTEFWRLFQAEYSLAKFMFVGTSVTGPITVPMTGLLGGFNSSSVISIPNELYVKKCLHSGNDAVLGLLNLFSYTLTTSAWTIDCSAAGFLTPMPVILLADFSLQAETFKVKMFKQAPNTHEAAMQALSKRNRRMHQDMFKYCTICRFCGWNSANWNNHCKILV